MLDLTDHRGAWTGMWRTYLEPGELYDESPLEATIAVREAGFVIEYRGSIQGQEVTGRIRWAEAGPATTVDWVDSWHTRGVHERLVGAGEAPPSYQYGDEDPWTWDITIAATDAGITVTHHNTGPGVPRYAGVVMRLDARRA